MTRLLLRLAAVSFIAVLLGGCFAIVIDPTEGLSVVINATTYDHSATFNFGSVEPGGEAQTITADITNVIETEIIVTSAAVSGTPFAVTTPDLPATIAPGETVSTSISFEPSDSGVSTGTLTVRIDGIDLAFVLNLVGEGNYPPTALEAVVVSGAGTAGANGTYLRSGTFNSLDDGSRPVAVDLPFFEQENGSNVIFGQQVEGLDWYIGPSTVSGDAYYYSISRDTAPNGSFFTLTAGTNPAPSVVAPFDVAFPSEGTTITVAYVYRDEEGDPEGGTTFRWFRSDTGDPQGTYSQIDLSAPTASYTATADDVARYLKVEVTPVAADGTPTGDPVLIGPSPGVGPFPLP